jgi:GNAT superfamily N-acetyltransferase
LEEYAAESAVKGMPHPFAKADAYKHLENTNSIYVIGAFLEEVFIGYIIMLSPILPHYSVRVAVVESYFVAKEYRKTGAGLRLLHEAERQAQEVGAFGAFVSAPFGGNLAEVLPHLGYDETSRIFFRSFNVSTH